MPRLWDHSIEAHRDAVRGAIMDAAWGLAAEHGPTGVTMAGVARAAGIGRATLHRHFAGPEAILLAWHERQVAEHLARLDGLAHGPGAALDRLEAVLAAWGAILRRSGRRAPDLGRLVHGGGTARAHKALAALVAGLPAEAATEGAARADAAPEELAAFCLHATGAAVALPVDAAVGRMATLAIDGVRHPRDDRPPSAG